MAKKYATKEQKKVLEDAGVLHKKGRSYQEADKIIDVLIEKGQVCPYVFDTPTEEQIEYLNNIGVPMYENMSKSHCTEIISRHKKRQHYKATKEQYDKIESYGVKWEGEMNKAAAEKVIKYLDYRKCKHCEHQNFESQDSATCYKCSKELPDTKGLVIHENIQLHFFTEELKEMNKEMDKILKSAPQRMVESVGSKVIKFAKNLFAKVLEARHKF